MSSDPVPDVPLLAGMGGVNSSESHSVHFGRKAIIISRDKNTHELSSLAQTMGIEIVDVVVQKGKANSKTYLGSGKLQQISEELQMAGKGHHWHNVDLLLIHSNLKSGQLVNINDLTSIESWDRVRLLLELFTIHASSVEAKNATIEDRKSFFTPNDDFINLSEAFRENPIINEVKITSEKEYYKFLDILTLQEKSIPLFIEKGKGLYLIPEFENTTEEKNELILSYLGKKLVHQEK